MLLDSDCGRSLFLIKRVNNHSLASVVGCWSGSQEPAHMHMSIKQAMVIPVCCRQYWQVTNESGRQ